MDVLHSLRPMCALLHYTSQKYNLVTCCRYSWRDLSYPSDRILPEEVMHTSVIGGCCLSTAAQHRAGQPGLDQLSGRGSLLYTRADEKHSSNPLLLALLGSRIVQPRAAISYFNCFKEAHLNKNCHLVLPFCKDDVSKYDSGTSLGSGF